MLKKLAVATGTVLIAGISVAFAQTTGTPVTTSGLTGSFSADTTNFLCSNNGAVLRYLLEYGGSIGSVVLGASVLGNFRSKLPPGIVKLLDILTLDFASALKAKAASADQQGKAAIQAQNESKK